ncbi:MAG TPA: hypothetical protein VJV23_05825 [Candidatus Polarisedimenticolia bacterium]|nr:hypothetical protein [Candidatus Polarisedimenticolia bacterium]
MPQGRRADRVDIYYRRRARARTDDFRFLMTEVSIDGSDALEGAREVVDRLQREFFGYEYILVVVRWQPEP